MTKKSTKTIKEFVENTVNQVLHESSLSRAWEWMQKHDCATMSAMRNDPFDLSACVNPPDIDNENNHLAFNKEPKDKNSVNKLRNKSLRANLLRLGYGVTPVDGSYIEDFGLPSAKHVNEDSFFVVNLKDDPDFVQNIEFLGQKFCQDSVLIIPKGGSGTYLLGTNNAWPGLGVKIEQGDASFGAEKQFMTKVRGRPFAFPEKLEEISSYGWSGRLAVHSIAEIYVNTKGKALKFTPVKK